MEDRGQWNQLFEVLKENCKPKLAYTEKISYKSEGKTNTFPDNQKQRICHQKTCTKRCTKKLLRELLSLALTEVLK